MDNNEFLEYFYKVTINSLVFSNNIDEDLNTYFKDFTTGEFLYILNLLKMYLEQKNNQQDFDYFAKNNIYKMTTFFCDKVQSNDDLNQIKIYLNNQSEDNSDFLRQQILLRDYATFKFANLKMYINLQKISSDIILENKKEYYSSINYDMLFLISLMISDKDFYDFDYTANAFNKSFYRSLNYFSCVKPDILMNSKNLERIKYVMDCDTVNLEKLSNEYYGELSEDFYEYIDIRNVSIKKIRKFLKRYI